VNTKTTAPASNYDGLKWAIVVVLLVGGVVANIYFSHLAWALRFAAWIVLAIILAAVALQTTIGHGFWTFAKDSRAELRKVVWPTRQETTQMTMIVIGLVILVALILWGADTFFMWLFGLVAR